MAKKCERRYYMTHQGIRMEERDSDGDLIGNWPMETYNIPEDVWDEISLEHDVIRFIDCKR